MIWAVDQDDDANTLLSTVSASDLCAGGSGDSIKHKCVPIDDVSERLVDSLSHSSQVRWWNPENSDETKQGRCGKYAPLIDGFYPVRRCDRRCSVGPPRRCATRTTPATRAVESTATAAAETTSASVPTAPTTEAIRSSSRESQLGRRCP